MKGIAPNVEALPATISAMLRKGQTPNGGAQPPNPKQTIERKIRQGKPPTPCLDDRKLTAPSLWDVKRILNGWIIRVPKQRRDALPHLQKKGFIILDIPEHGSTESILKLGLAFISI